jgi:hypothetical protein
MVTVFLDCEGLLLCEFLLPKPTLNSDNYCDTLGEAIKQKRPGQLTTGVRLPHDAARPRTSALTVAWLQKQNRETLLHTPHSPDLVPYDFYLSGPFNKFVSGKKMFSRKSLGQRLC